MAVGIFPIRLGFDRCHVLKAEEVIAIDAGSWQAFPGRSDPERSFMIAWMLPVIAVAGYLAILVLVYLHQEKLLYFPDLYPRATAATRAKTFHFRLWPENGPDYHGFIPADGPGSPKGVILLFHGNAGTAPDRFFYARYLTSLGYLLILFEYPGYGARPGDLREVSFVSAAVDAARAAVERFGGPLVLLGESLGCGVAAAVAGSGQVPVAGVVLITPFDTLPGLAQSVFWYLPAKWMTRDRYDNVQNLSRYGGPVAVAAAEEDEVIPPKRSRRLFELLPGKKRFWLLPGAGHNTWPDVVDSAWWSEVLGFVSEGGGGPVETGERPGGS
jgi:alpha-beta hydrolase superfamily lysophospholipase